MKRVLAKSKEFSEKENWNAHTYWNGYHDGVNKALEIFSEEIKTMRGK